MSTVSTQINSKVRMNIVRRANSQCVCVCTSTIFIVSLWPQTCWSKKFAPGRPPFRANVLGVQKSRKKEEKTSTHLLLTTFCFKYMLFLRWKFKTCQKNVGFLNSLSLCWSETPRKMLKKWKQKWKTAKTSWVFAGFRLEQIQISAPNSDLHFFGPGQNGTI